MAVPDIETRSAFVAMLSASGNWNATNLDGVEEFRSAGGAPLLRAVARCHDPLPAEAAEAFLGNQGPCTYSMAAQLLAVRMGVWL